MNSCLQKMASILLLSFFFAACGEVFDDRNSTIVDAGPIHGVAFGPFWENQDPTRADEVAPSQIRERLEILRARTRWIRTYGSTSGLEPQAEIARELGFNTAIGAWLDRDLNSNEREIDNLIAAAEAGNVDIAIVGSEAILRGDLTVDQLVEYIEHVRSMTQGLPIEITTAERFAEYRAIPELVEAVDLVLANYYPFWEGIALEEAIPLLHDWHSQLVRLAAGKPVLVGETGWPSGGTAVGQALPTPENAAAYFLQFVSWAEAENVEYFYFEGFDEPWKIAAEGPVGPHWGIWTTDAELKPGMEDVFSGNRVEDFWTPVLIDGPGEPTIVFTSIDDFARGRASHVESSSHRVAVYIRVRGGWWTKPFFNAPLTSIAPNGNWSADVVTGGVDNEADRVAAFLVRSDYSPPTLSGASALPEELFDNALAYAEAPRSG